MRRDETGRTVALTRNRAEDTAPAVSPDGRTVVFASDRHGAYLGDFDLYAMPVAGGPARRLTRTRHADTYPAWSPDGRQIAFASRRGDRETEIYAMRADGRDQRRVTRTRRTATNTHPSFSPDGARLVFASNRRDDFNLDLYRMDLAGEPNLKRLTRFAGGGEQGLGNDAMPEYSPDGTRIVFASDRTGTHQLWTMDPDGGDLRRLTGHTGLDVYFPRWSADGASLLYMTSKPDGSKLAVWTSAADGTGPRRLAAGAQPDW